MIIQRLFSKVYMPGGSKEVSELNDKQLENLSKYGKTDASRKNIRKSGQRLTITGGVMGGGIGALSSGYKAKAAAKGSVVGLGAGAGLALYGNHRNKKLAKEAEEELKKRKQASLK